MRISDWSSDVCSSDLAVAVSTILLRQCYDILRQRLFVIRPARHLALRRSMRPQNPTYPSLGHLDRQISSYLIDTAPSSRGAQKFPFAASCRIRSEEHTSELQSLMRISYAVF